MSQSSEAARRVFLVVFPTMRGDLAFCIYHDELPTKSMLHGQTPLYQRELTGTKWAEMSLTEIIAEYHRRVAAQTLPPSISVPVKPKKDGDRPLPEAERNAEIFKRRFRTGDIRL